MKYIETNEQLIKKEKELLKEVVRRDLVSQEKKFDPYKWDTVRTDTNCYAYALGAAIILYNYFFFLPGTLSMEKPEEYSFDEKLVETRLFMDCDILNIKIHKSTLEENIPANGRKIALLVNDHNFHFLRCDSNGFWSHKSGWDDLPTNRDDLGLFIKNPEKMNICGDFDFVGYYIITT